jgi:hypothetical protein
LESVREDRVRTLVLGVLDGILKKSGAPGVVISGGGPERSLLLEWLALKGIPVFHPSHEAVSLAQEVLLSTSGLESPPVAPWQDGSLVLASLALARQENLLLLGTTTKTFLLLSPPLPLEPVLPLGDLYASDVLEMRGECSIPPILEGIDARVLRAVDQGLQEFLEGNLPIREALPHLPPDLRQTLREGLTMTRRAWTPRTLVPQLRSITLGIDLHL